MTASSVSPPARDHFAPIVADRTVVLVTTDPVAAESILRRLYQLDPGWIVVLGPPCLRPLTTEVDAELVQVNLEGATPEITRQAWEALLADPPPGLRSLLDARDPDRTALVLISPEFTTVELLGRPAFGANPPSWAASADKLLADHLWEVAGVAQHV